MALFCLICPLLHVYFFSLFNYPSVVLLFIRFIQCCSTEKVTLPTVEWKAFRAGHWKTAQSWIGSFVWQQHDLSAGEGCCVWREKQSHGLLHYSSDQLARTPPVCTNVPRIILDIVSFNTNNYPAWLFFFFYLCRGTFNVLPRYYLSYWVPQLSKTI